MSNNAGRGEQSKISAYDAALRRVTVQNAFTITPNTSSGIHYSPTITISGDGNDAKSKIRRNQRIWKRNIGNE